MKNLIKDILKKISSGILFGMGIILVTITTMAFQAPSGGDATPSTTGYTSASSWISTNITSMMGTLTAIKTKTDTITTGWSFCDPNSGKYCNKRVASECDGTEVFIQIDSINSTGYCIEKDQRTADYWEEAKKTCEALWKRLPEPFEWKYACKHPPTGLVNMIGDLEWASNTTTLTTNVALLGIAFGTNSCSTIAIPVIGATNWAEVSVPTFRCVR